MHLFGHYPAHDDFYLVVCSACNQVVKPQVFQSHCGKWTPALADVHHSRGALPCGLALGLSEPTALGESPWGSALASKLTALGVVRGSPPAKMFAAMGTLDRKRPIV